MRDSNCSIQFTKDTNIATPLTFYDCKTVSFLTIDLVLVQHAVVGMFSARTFTTRHRRKTIAEKTGQPILALCISIAMSFAFFTNVTSLTISLYINIWITSKIKQQCAVVICDCGWCDRESRNITRNSIKFNL